PSQLAAFRAAPAVRFFRRRGGRPEPTGLISLLTLPFRAFCGAGDCPFCSQSSPIAFPAAAINVGGVQVQQQEAIMIYELRIYHCVTGRLPALLKRFETTTLELWKRHGIRQAGFWTVLVGDGGNQDLHYLLAWESLAEREAKWNKFASDPEWLAKRAESERDGPIVASIKNMFLQPTAFSAVK